MNLEQVLTDAVRRLRAGGLKNEAQVKQSVILPILRAIGWNTDAPEQLSAEFQAGSGRVDYALLHYEQPKVFIEAKRIGYAEDPKAQEQLFGYAMNRGIPILVLTDGRKWDFYFGMGAGAWKERRFRRLVLDDDQNVSTYSEFLTAHLGRNAVASGDAQMSAHRLLLKHQALERAKRTLPDVWRALLTQPHPELCKLLSEWVEAKCEVKARSEDIVSFLKDAAMGLGRNNAVDSPVSGDGSEPFEPSHTMRHVVANRGRFDADRGDEPMPALPVSGRTAAVPKSRQGLKTAQHEFTRPILQVLIEMGGEGKRREVLDRVSDVMGSRLGAFDRETHKNGSVRWEKTAEFQCTEMRKTGLLKPVLRRGWWEISDQGRLHLREQR
ncbi:MAG: type I restriction endonuclease [Candidatus Tectomicrobia bacterium]|nr:type I restriction endonuclease [Candidatus Tectomicrobia bacterium]